MRRILAGVCLIFVAASCGSGGAPSETIAGTPSLLKSTLQSMQGKPVVVNFWATWCAPCKKEMPHIVAAAKRYEGKVGFLGVNVQDDAEAAAAFAKDYGMRFRSIADPDKDITNAEKLLGLPATQFYDAEGELSFLKQGEISNDELIEKIEDVIRASR
jgi:thiol-disulfide isomerase/thioredoxin